jgi:hypothetical protein
VGGDVTHSTPLMPHRYVIPNEAKRNEESFIQISDQLFLVLISNAKIHVFKRINISSTFEEKFKRQEYEIHPYSNLFHSFLSEGGKSRFNMDREQLRQTGALYNYARRGKIVYFGVHT